VNIILVGYRGTGKSAVARELAHAMGLIVVSLDVELQRKVGKSIPEIVEEIGWPGFRDREEEIVRTFAAEDGQVLDCGGGVIEREANFAQLRSAGIVIWLTASIPTIVARIGPDDQRPSLTGTKSFTDEVEDVLQRRIPRYQRIAHHEVENDGRTIKEVVREIRQLVLRDHPD
jgi:shikimate kinase